MRSIRARLSGLTLVVLLGALPWRVGAQNPTQTARAFVASPAALGMGDAAVAVVMTSGVFFYNPAALALLKPRPARFEVSVQAATTRLEGLSAPDRYIRDRLLPAVTAGLETFTPAERRALFGEARALGAGRTSGGRDVLVRVSQRRGPLGLGAGAFVHGFEQYHALAGAAGIPALVVARQRDASLLVSGAFDFSDFGMPGLALGATAKVQHRQLALKDKAIDAFAPQEHLNVQQGIASGLDLAAIYTLPARRLPGHLRFGLALYDVATTGFEYAPAFAVPYTALATADTARTVAGRRRERGEALRQVQAQAQGPLQDAELRRVQNEYELAPSYRAGVSYTAPSLFGALGETTVAVDVQQFTNPGGSRSFNVDPAFVTRLHAGLQVGLSRALRVRGGLAQGYPSGGLGLRLGPVQADYAFAGQEDGRRAGDAPVWQHLLRVGVAF